MAAEKAQSANPTHPIASTRSGWRFFVCDECGQKWRETSRDRLSPSGVDCECCGDWCTPVCSTGLPAVDVDDFGNLVKHETLVVIKGVDPSC